MTVVFLAFSFNQELHLLNRESNPLLKLLSRSLKAHRANFYATVKIEPTVNGHYF